MLNDAEESDHNLRATAGWPFAHLKMPPKKKKLLDKNGMPVQWNHSIARDLLCNDVSNGLICKNTPVKVAHESRPEHLLYDQLAFEGYLDTIFETFDIKQSRAQRDAIAVAEFRNIHPKKPETHRGEPRWEGSEAESKLNQLVADGKHKGVKPSKLREDMDRCLMISANKQFATTFTKPSVHKNSSNASMTRAMKRKTHFQNSMTK